MLGGGGVAGIAWETGILTGLADAGVDVTDAELTIGTSAGSTVAAQLGSGLPLEELFRRQADPAAHNRELAPTGAGGAEFLDTLARLMAETADPAELRRRVGALALAADTVPEPVRRAVIANRLPSTAWPDRALIVAVDAATGEPRIFGPDSGVDLVDAVAASCAIPCVWPPVTIGDARYVDGGVRSMANVDLAAGCERALVIAPITDDALWEPVEGCRMEIVTPDEQTLAAFEPDPLDPATRTPAARAGRAQGRRCAGQVAAFWA
ncbi:NTE family protein [Actinokineospora alba]|uniref:NTE family protein n=1 Tax=Actinokineospora alba TaxID=504798 RepID=A0A1H0VUC4_9PSEU|nr:NTE family protein [Actinokineospora alba]SDI39799.1 NTE family protein [Actinokineospora alba]SDP82050.1 NTE family protein [Actinokineospora alba]